MRRGRDVLAGARAARATPPQQPLEVFASAVTAGEALTNHSSSLAAGLALHAASQVPVCQGSAAHKGAQAACKEPCPSVRSYRTAACRAQRARRLHGAPRARRIPCCGACAAAATACRAGRARRLQGARPRSARALLRRLPGRWRCHSLAAWPPGPPAPHQRACALCAQGRRPPVQCALDVRTAAKH